MYENVYTIFGATDDDRLVAANLAVSFASVGYRTLIINADPTNSYLQRVLGTHIDEVHSLKSAFSQPIPSITVMTATKNLWILGPQDNVVAIDYDFLTAAHAETIINEAAQYFERIVISTGGGLYNEFSVQSIATQNATVIVPYRNDTASLAWVVSFRPVVERLNNSRVFYLLITDRYELSESEFFEFSSGVAPHARINMGDTSKILEKPLAAANMSSAGTKLRKTLLSLCETYYPAGGDMNYGNYAQ